MSKPEISKASIFTVGGTVQAGSGVYICRKADTELLELCRKGEFTYVLSTRQIGKSSLMVHTSEQLNREGILSAIVDLTRIGVQVTAEQWYLGVITGIADDLELEIDPVEWWVENHHLGPTQRLTLFFEKVLLANVRERVVIFMDEIDSTIRLPFADDFYATIRYLYNSRAHVPDLQRLSFALLGVATPSELIKDPTRTPFNIGRRVDLTDFTFEEALPLAAGLGPSSHEAREVLRRILSWTGGHPYLTQRLCREIGELSNGSRLESDVDRIVENTFLGRASKDDSNLSFVRDMLTKRAPDRGGVLTTYRKIYRERRPVFDEERSEIKTHLKLSGVVYNDDGLLRVRNRIYRMVFDEQWIKENLPVNLKELIISSSLTAIFMGLAVTGTLFPDSVLGRPWVRFPLFALVLLTSLVTTIRSYTYKLVK